MKGRVHHKFTAARIPVIPAVVLWLVLDRVGVSPAGWYVYAVLVTALVVAQVSAVLWEDWRRPVLDGDTVTVRNPETGELTHGIVSFGKVPTTLQDAWPATLRDGRGTPTGTAQ